MRPRRTILVLVLVAVGLVGVVLSERSRRSSSDTAGAVGRRALITETLLPVHDVTEITLTRGDDDPLVFVRGGAEHSWRQVEPFEHPMDTYSIRQLMVLARQLEVTDVIEPDQVEGVMALTNLGLDPPAAVLICRWPEGELRLDCGRWGLAGRAYIQMGGDPSVYVVGAELHDRAIEMDDKEWRDRRLFPTASVDSERIELTTGEGTTVLEREGRIWHMAAPVRTRVDPEARDQLIQNLARIESGGFVADQPESLEQFGLDPPAGSVSVTTTQVAVHEEGHIEREQVTRRLLVGPRIGGSQDRFGLFEGGASVVRLTPAVIQACFPGPDQLADPTASGVAAADVKAMVIQSAGAELRLERDLQQWRETDLPNREVQSTLVEELLDQLTQLRATRVKVQAYPRELEQATITLIDFGDRPLDTVRIAKDPENGEWAFENGDGVLRVHPASMKVRLTREDFGLSAARLPVGETAQGGQ